MSIDHELVPVWICQQPAVVQQNLVDLSARLLTIQETVKALPRTEENLAEVKRNRAEIRKYFEALEQQRKLVKQEVMEPYERAVAAYKDLVAVPIDKVDKLCKAFVDEVESGLKKACEDRLRAYFTEMCQSKGIFWLEFDRIGLKIDMATAKAQEPRKALRYIKEFVEQVDQTMAAISGMDNAGDILTEYTKTLDLSAAIARVDERKRARETMERNRAKWQETKESKSRNAALVEATAAQMGHVVRPEPDVKEFRMVFAATASRPMLRALVEFAHSHNIKIQEVNENGQ